MSENTWGSSASVIVKNTKKYVPLTPRRRILFLLTTGLIMLDTLRRIFEGTRPIDTIMLIIELLVLLLIAYEVWAGIQARRQERKRKKEVEKRVSAMAIRIANGSPLSSI